MRQLCQLPGIGHDLAPAEILWGLFTEDGEVLTALTPIDGCLRCGTNPRPIDIDLLELVPSGTRVVRFSYCARFYDETDA